MKIDFNKLNKKKCIILLLIIIFAIFIFIINNTKENYDELTIMLDNEFIELKATPIIEEKEDNVFDIYFSKEDIANLFNKDMFYNEMDGQIITTHNSHIANLFVDSKTATIDDEEIEIDVIVKKEKGIVYMSISNLAKVYDLEIYYSRNSNRIIIDSLDKEKTEVTVKQRTKLKKGKGLFSKKIETLIIGDNLVVLEDNGKYKKVRSPLGNIGYIKTKKVSEEEKVRENINYTKVDLTPYFSYSNASGIYDDIEVDKTKRNVVLPELFSIEENGKFIDKTNINSATFSVYKNWSERNSFEILPTLVENGNVSETLLTYEQRTNIINNLKEKLLEYEFFGININFKTIDDFNSFYRFIYELVPRFRAANLKVIVTVNNNNLDRSKFENIVDCIIEE